VTHFAPVRTGIGYDSHRFADGGPMRLGGIDVPSAVHLAGHSDGDAICHALTDAILGACAGGDIGALFPDTDPANTGKDSVVMLEAAVRRAAELGWRVANADVTVIAEQPKVGPHRARMIERLAPVLGIPGDALMLKGKTNEGMGWIGRGEGLATIAVATLVPIGAP
jgi:2-C-methyl-D-erythritol 2,4-cyclodiphosphate synthase